MHRLTVRWRAPAPTQATVLCLARKHGSTGVIRCIESHAGTPAAADVALARGPGCAASLQPATGVASPVQRTPGAAARRPRSMYEFESSRSCVASAAKDDTCVAYSRTEAGEAAAPDRRGCAGKQPAKRPPRAPGAARAQAQAPSQFVGAGAAPDTHPPGPRTTPGDGAKELLRTKIAAARAERAAGAGVAHAIHPKAAAVKARVAARRRELEELADLQEFERLEAEAVREAAQLEAERLRADEAARQERRSRDAQEDARLKEELLLRLAAARCERQHKKAEAAALLEAESRAQAVKALALKNETRYKSRLAKEKKNKSGAAQQTPAAASTTAAHAPPKPKRAPLQDLLPRPPATAARARPSTPNPHTAQKHSVIRASEWC